MTRYKTFMINCALVVLGIGIVLVAIEVLLAVSKFNTPAIQRFIPGKGMTFIPNAYYRFNKEGFSEGRFNSHGFRDYERTYEKATDVFRILVLGDSFTEALQVPLENSFTAQLEKMLNDTRVSSSRFEVLSLGQSGFGTADEYLRYLNFGAAYNPDLVILAFFTGNDFRNNSKFLSLENVAFYYEFDERGELVLDRSLVDAYERSLTFSKRLLEELKSKSHLLNLISERVYLLRRQLLESRIIDGHQGEEGDGDSKEQNLDLFMEPNIYRTDMPPAWVESVEITKGIILKFRKTVVERGGKFLLLSLPGAEQVHPEVGNKQKSRYRMELDYEQPDRILEEFARENSTSFLKLMPEFRNYHIKSGQYLHGFGLTGVGHWNQTGHRLAAELTCKFLMENKLVPLENKASCRL